MNFYVDEQGIHFVIDEPQPIPLDDAVKAVEAIAEKQREALEQCTQGATDGSN